MAQKTSFYMSDELEKTLKKYITRYGSVSRAITNIVFSMDTMYRTERSYLRQLFTQQEIHLMLNNALSTHYTPEGVINRVLFDTEDEIDAQFVYFEVDRESVLKKLRGLTVSQQFALVDWLIEMRGNDDVENEPDD